VSFIQQQHLAERERGIEMREAVPPLIRALVLNRGPLAGEEGGGGIG